MSKDYSNRPVSILARKTLLALQRQCEFVYNAEVFLLGAKREGGIPVDVSVLLVALPGAANSRLPKIRTVK